jgi:hypothetical protein
VPAPSSPHSGWNVGEVPGHQRLRCGRDPGGSWHPALLIQHSLSPWTKGPNRYFIEKYSSALCFSNSSVEFLLPAR